ncbi:MAG: beta-galactosidase, partial [Endomicrobiia bacterium]
MEIKLENQMFVIDGKPTYIYSGEIHYWRIPRQDWRKHLKLAKEAGLNTVSTYIPWCIHEAEDGKINLDEFIDYCSEVKNFGLYLISRVGPISNAELLLEGLPKWLSEKHPEIYVKGKDLINLPHATLVSYNNPTFLNYVKRWYGKVLPIVAKNQVIDGGNIVLVQLCNEIGMVHWLNKAIDYSEQSQKMYREYLRKKYVKIDYLNKKYGTNYTDFNEIKLPDNKVEEDKISKYIDLIYFCSDYYAQYYNVLYNEAKKY